MTYTVWCFSTFQPSERERNEKLYPTSGVLAVFAVNTIIICIKYQQMKMFDDLFEISFPGERKVIRDCRESKHCPLIVKEQQIGKHFKSKGYSIKSVNSNIGGSVLLLGSVLPLSFPGFNTAIIHVVLLSSVVDKFPIVAPIFLERSKDLRH